jgi:hypothetical protein
MFYDGPEPPQGIFNDFLAIPEIPITVGSSSFLKFLDLLPASDPLAPRSVVPILHLRREIQFRVERILAASPSWTIPLRS